MHTKPFEPNGSLHSYNNFGISNSAAKLHLLTFQPFNWELRILTYCTKGFKNRIKSLNWHCKEIILVKWIPKFQRPNSQVIRIIESSLQFSSQVVKRRKWLTYLSPRIKSRASRKRCWNTSKGTRPYSKKTLVKLSLTLFSSSHVRHRQVSSPLIDEGGGDLMKESFW